MSWLDAIILGLVQGLTEFLPVSSSAHIRIVGELTGSTDPGAAFTAITQIGTELAVVIVFWKDIVRILSAWFRSLPLGAKKNQCPQVIRRTNGMDDYCQFTSDLYSRSSFKIRSIRTCVTCGSHFGDVDCFRPTFGLVSYALKSAT